MTFGIIILDDLGVEHGRTSCQYTRVDMLISTCFGASDRQSLCSLGTLCPHDILDPDTKDQSGFRPDLFLLNS